MAEGGAVPKGSTAEGEGSGARDGGAKGAVTVSEIAGAGAGAGAGAKGGEMITGIALAAWPDASASGKMRIRPSKT